MSKTDATGEPGATITAADFQDSMYVNGSRKWVLLISLTSVFFLLFALYAGVLAVLLPNQIQSINPDNKSAGLAFVFAVTSVFSTLVTPMAGAFSDRTRTPWGRRAPWIVIGSLVGAVCLILTSQMSTIPMITLFWVGATIAFNSMQSAANTLIADRFAPAERGTASGFIGAGMTSGLTVGTIVAGLLASQLVLAYSGFAISVAIACLAFVFINPEPKTTLPKPDAFNLTDFLKSFWISPRKHPDFAWAFAGRFTIYMGYQAVITYMLYILQDYIGLSKTDANTTIATLSTITFFALVFSAFSSGFLSDWLGKRKPLVFAASIIMGLALTAPLILPTVQGMLIYAAVIGLGYGAFMSVDMALMTQVLPKADGEATGKDLGILTTAVNIPQILSPIWAAWLLNMTGDNYKVLFISAIAFVFAGSFFVLPIRSVK
ncbi:MFS transporter [Hirschia baltica]|uniref:Major facilitator superfamily MFS_1 n=1 Tax=Hirschia baltica (strain ATCC 49814 / DSM 5838 / IFAM 1418) TaxID=582402 RepID=C6XPU4_HIRBI|nr:MFS transporter [Hirschia baltica]ACT60359.1 major facilitator superfamily MFS_1 [Hirschia baltica ATCC 49814]